MHPFNFPAPLPRGRVGRDGTGAGEPGAMRAGSGDGSARQQPRSRARESSSSSPGRYGQPHSYRWSITKRQPHRVAIPAPQRAAYLLTTLHVRSPARNRPNLHGIAEGGERGPPPQRARSSRRGAGNVALKRDTPAKRAGAGTYKATRPTSAGNPQRDTPQPPSEHDARPYAPAHIVPERTTSQAQA